MAHRSLLALLSPEPQGHLIYWHQKYGCAMLADGEAAEDLAPHNVEARELYTISV